MQYPLLPAVPEWLVQLKIRNVHRRRRIQEDKHGAAQTVNGFLAVARPVQTHIGTYKTLLVKQCVKLLQMVLPN